MKHRHATFLFFFIGSFLFHSYSHHADAKTNTDFTEHSSGWTKLSLVDGSHVLYYPCGANIRSIQFIRNPDRNNAVQIIWEYGNDTGVFDIMRTECGDHACILKVLNVDSNEEILIKAEYNDSLTSTWSTSIDNFANAEQYVRTDHRDKFKVIHEGCE